MEDIKMAPEMMPCPRCRTLHAHSEYRPRPELAEKPLGELLNLNGVPYPPGHRLHGVRSGTPFAPLDVHCFCGATLRHVVPIFCCDLYGWHWEIM